MTPALRDRPRPGAEGIFYAGERKGDCTPERPSVHGLRWEAFRGIMSLYAVGRSVESRTRRGHLKLEKCPLKPDRLTVRIGAILRKRLNRLAVALPLKRWCQTHELPCAHRRVALARRSLCGALPTPGLFRYIFALLRCDRRRFCR